MDLPAHAGRRASARGDGRQQTQSHHAGGGRSRTLASIGAEWLPDPIELALRSHEEWYKGDGIYGDGAEFHRDYYNSYVIQPMLLSVLDAFGPADARWQGLRDSILRRARRYAAVQERLIAPDGSYPPLGRSLTYRCGAFHHLAALASHRQPEVHDARNSPAR